MHLVQILLPIYAGDGQRIPQELFAAVRTELVDRFGGLTAYSRSPARGLWDDGKQVERDDLVVYEVMAEDLDRDWWARYGTALAERFGQQELVVRSHPIERL